MPSLFRTLSLGQIRRHRGRALLIIASIALGVAAWITSASLDRAMLAALRASSTPMAGAADLYASNGESGLTHDLGDSLSRVDGVASVGPVVVARVLLPEPGGQMAVLLGVDLMKARARADASGLSVGEGATAGFLKAKLLGKPAVLASESLRRALRPETSRLKVIADGSPRELAVAGTFDMKGDAAALGGFVLLTDDRTAAEVAGHPDRVSRFDIRLEPGTDLDDARRRLAEAMGGVGEVLTPESQAGRALESLGALRIGFALCGVASLGLGLFLVANVLAVGVAERRREIGTLRSVGATRGQVVGLFLVEAAALGLVGGLIGVPLGWSLARPSLGPMLQVLGDIFVPLDSPGLIFDLRTALLGVAAALLTTLLAALASALRAAAQPPVVSLAIGPDAGRNSGRWRKFAPALLATAAVACFASGDVLPMHLRQYLALVLGLLAAVLIIPDAAVVVAFALRPVAQGLLGPAGRLAAESLIRAPTRGGVAIAAVATGVALMVQTGGVIQGNAEAVREWVDRSISGDLFATSGGPLSASGRTLPMADEVGARIEDTIPRAKVVPMRFRHLPWKHDGVETKILLLALDAPRYVAMSSNRRPPLPDLDLYRQLAEPGTVLVSENFARLYSVAVGDSVALPGSGGAVRLRVVGTVVDFSSSRGVVMVDRTRYRDAFAAGGADVFAVALPSSSSDLEESRGQLLRAPWAAEHAIDVMTRPALRGHILGMVGRLYGLAYLQEIIVAVVAALGVATTMLISVLQRRRELRLLRAVGATKLQVFATVMAEAVMIDLIGVVFGVLIGVPLGWYVLRVILLNETGFSFPVRFPVADGALIAALVVVSGLPAGLIPALDAARGEITEGRTRG